MGVVVTLEGRCRKCYSCIRHCPAKAIKVENEQAKVVPERCISCGYCLTVCSQKAKYMERELPVVKERIAGGEELCALVAPSFPAQFYQVTPGQVAAGLRALGFKWVYEVAYGAELVTSEYIKLLKENPRGKFISTPCSAIVNLVERHYPDLLGYLAPVVSPMVAAGRAAKRALAARTNSGSGRGVITVFIGPCVAKKEEARDDEVSDAVDQVLTFRELRTWLEEAGLDFKAMPAEEFDNPPVVLGKLYPVSGGLLRSAARLADILEYDIVTVEGRERCLEFLTSLQRGEVDPKFVDILFCEGCIAGPMLENDLSAYMRKKTVVAPVREAIQALAADGGAPCLAVAPDGLRMRRSFHDKSQRLRVPTEEEIRAILRELDKVSPEDELNCGACGYKSCRDKAVAVFQGLAENKMCLPWLISQLERNNAELTYLRDYNKNIIDSITESVLVVDSEGVITVFNDPKENFGVPRHEAVGKRILDALPQLGTQDMLRALDFTISQGQPAQVSELRYARPGRVRVMNIKGYPLKDDKGNTYGAVFICEDVTEQKRMFAQLVESEKLASIGRLAAGVAHEINNPLTLIAGYIEILAGLSASLGKEAEENVKIIGEEVDRIAQIVRNLLSFARPPATETQTCRIPDVVRRIVSLVGRQFGVRGVNLEIDVPEDLPKVNGSSAEVEQVFLNLMMNALEAMPEGGVLRLRARAIQALLPSGGPEEDGERRPVPAVEITFTDTGCGIPEENLRRIFDPFFTTKDVGKGSGLGLSICYGIVKRCGGSITVSSEVGVGTTFTVSLPAATDERKAR